MSSGIAVLGPAEENVACGLHRTLALDHPTPGMTMELDAHAFQHRFARFLELKEQRRTIGAQEQADGAESTNAPNSDYLEGDILERIALQQIAALRRQPMVIGSEYALGVQSMLPIAFFGEMIDERRPISDAGSLTLHQMRKVVILLALFSGLGQH